MTAMLELSKISALIDAHLSKRLGVFGFERAEMRIGRDHDGDETIFVVAHYKPAAPELDASTSLTVAIELNELIGAQGDERFVHLTHFWPDEEPTEEAFPRQRRVGARR